MLSHRLSFSSMASGSVLEVMNVSVRRGEKIILGPINFTINSGERWVILGPNGAGKSTLLQILATKIFPTTGTVLILEKEMGRVDLIKKFKLLIMKLSKRGALPKRDVTEILTELVELGY